MVVDTVTLPVPISVEELQTALEEIGKEEEAKAKNLGLTDPKVIHDKIRDRISTLVQAVKRDETNPNPISPAELVTTVTAWWDTREENQSATVQTN